MFPQLFHQHYLIVNIFGNYSSVKMAVMSINDSCLPSHFSFRPYMKLLLNLYVKYTHLQGWRESAVLQGNARIFKQNLLVIKSLS